MAVLSCLSDFLKCERAQLEFPFWEDLEQRAQLPVVVLPTWVTDPWIVPGSTVVVPFIKEATVPVIEELIKPITDPLTKYGQETIDKVLIYGALALVAIYTIPKLVK